MNIQFDKFGACALSLYVKYNYFFAQNHQQATNLGQTQLQVLPFKIQELQDTNNTKKRWYISVGRFILVIFQYFVYLYIFLLDIPICFKFNKKINYLCYNSLLSHLLLHSVSSKLSPVYPESNFISGTFSYHFLK